MRGILVLFGFLAFLVLGIALATTYTVDEGETGVILTNGAISGEATSGRHFKNPLFDEVVYVSNRAQTYQFENVQAYSLDQQVATLQLSTTFSVPKGESKAIYARYGSVDSYVSRVLSPRTQTVFKTIFGKTTALKATSEQDKLLIAFKEQLQEAIGTEVVLESVQIENLDFSDKYEKNVEDRASAEVAVLTQQQTLREEQVKAEIKVTQAQANADSALATQRANAEGSLLKLPSKKAPMGHTFAVIRIEETTHILGTVPAHGSLTGDIDRIVRFPVQVKLSFKRNEPQHTIPGNNVAEGRVIMLKDILAPQKKTRGTILHDEWHGAVRAVLFQNEAVAKSVRGFRVYKG